MGISAGLFRRAIRKTNPSCAFQLRVNAPFIEADYEYWWADHHDKPETWLEYFNRKLEIYLTAEGLVNNLDVENLFNKYSIGCDVEDFWNFIQKCANYKDECIETFARKIARAIDSEGNPFLESEKVFAETMGEYKEKFAIDEAQERLSIVHENGSFADTIAIIHCLGDYYEPGEINAKILYDIIISDCWQWFLSTENLKYYESCVRFFKRHLPNGAIATIMYSIEDEKWTLSPKYKAILSTD
jgi:hypothetical protein